jgi:hypothetical protein
VLKTTNRGPFTRKPLQGKIMFFLNGGVYSLTRGLLMGDPQAALLRDIVERHGISQPLVLRWMVRQLLGNE